VKATKPLKSEPPVERIALGTTQALYAGVGLEQTLSNARIDE
jgi:hypothetical protein